MNTKIRFGCFDHIFMNLFGIYFFEGKLEKKEMEVSLKQLIDLIPILSSVVVKDENGYFFKPVKPYNVEIVEKDIDEDLYTMFRRDSSGVADFKEGMIFGKICDTVEISSDWDLSNPKLGVPLMRVSLLHTPSKKTILGVSVNHCVADAHSFAMMMDAWSNGSKRMIKNFKFSRSVLKRTDGFDLFKTKRESMNRLKDMHPQKDCPEDDLGFCTMKGDECVMKHIHFSREALVKLRQHVKNNPNNVKFSSNDLMSAYCWKLHTIISRDAKKAKTGDVPFKIICNIRNRYPNVDESFFGNAITIVNTDLKHDEILKVPYEQLVLSVRKLVNSLDEETCQTMIDCLQYSVDVWGKDVFPKFNRKACIIMNDWRTLNRNLPSFGGLKCERMLFNPPNLWNVLYPYVFTVLMSEKGGYVIECAIPNGVYQKIKHLDLSDLDSLQKIQDILK